MKNNNRTEPVKKIPQRKDIEAIRLKDKLKNGYMRGIKEINLEKVLMDMVKLTMMIWVKKI